MPGAWLNGGRGLGWKGRGRGGGGRDEGGGRCCGAAELRLSCERTRTSTLRDCI